MPQEALMHNAWCNSTFLLEIGDLGTQRVVFPLECSEILIFITTTPPIIF